MTSSPDGEVQGQELPLCPCTFFILGSIHGFISACISQVMYAANFQCAGCFEWVETTVDESGGSRQQYVEDCQVCCKPNVLDIRWDNTAQEYTITAELES